MSPSVNAPPLHQVYTGPYDKLNECYRATFDWVAAEGYESSMPVFERYENDPKTTAPEELRTKIFIPIVPKETPKP